MRSRADRLVVGAEWALRTLSVAIIALLLWRSLRPPVPVDAVPVAGARDLVARLEAWSSVESPAAVHVRFDSTPDPAVRAWLVALGRAGTAVGWSGAGIPATAIAVDAIPDPRGRSRIAVAAPAGTRIAIADAAGVIDTLRSGGAVPGVSGNGASLLAPALAGVVSAGVDGQWARAMLPARPLARPVLLLARAGWEGKFVIAALEERGWEVHARMPVAPGAIVRQGMLGVPDTALYAAVVALDSTAAAMGAAIVRYVRDGGGLVLAGSSAAVPTLAAIAPGAVGRRVSGAVAAVNDSAPLNSLSFFPVTRLQDDAVPVARRPSSGVVAAARRELSGRVVQVGIDESWRWRMTNSDGAADAHREWWSHVVGAVAFAPPPPPQQPPP
ncbi:MAG: hypothetical protein ACRENI_07580, partial [Gemmatimonadaceae bacterium]